MSAKEGKEKKRKFLDHFASEYGKPSKYLLISNDDEEDQPYVAQESPFTQQLTDSNIALIESSDLSESLCNKSLEQIGDDCLMEIVEFLDLDDLHVCICVSKTWAKMMIPHFMSFCKDVYENEEHLERLREYGMENDGELIFTERATWKARLCYDDLPDDWVPCYGHYSDDEDVIEHNDCEFYRKLIPSGSPLCKGTLQEQYGLVQHDIDLQTYKELVEKQLGISQEEQVNHEIDPFVVYKKIVHERDMIDMYINDVQKSILNDDEFENSGSSEHGQIDSKEFTYHCLRSGISRLTKRSVMLFYEPEFIEGALYQLKEFIYSMIKDAYETKFPNKTEESQFQESLANYSKFYFAAGDDELDTDKKLNHEDIMASYKKLTGYTLHYADDSCTNMIEYHPRHPVTIYYDSEGEEHRLTNNNEKDSGPMEGSEEEEEEDEEEYESFSEYSSEEDIEQDEDENMANPIPITEENFIDDSQVYNFDLDNLGDSLPEQLMKVSIRVHEQVFGKERAHKEKLFLKNWYGEGNLFFSNCSKLLDNPLEDGDYDDELDHLEGEENTDTLVAEIPAITLEGEIKLTEKQQIEMDMKEDIEYFGYSLFEDEWNEFPIIVEEDSSAELEQASEEESLQYQLRRMLREQSYECIVLFNRSPEISYKTKYHSSFDMPRRIH